MLGISVVGGVLLETAVYVDRSIKTTDEGENGQRSPFSITSVGSW